jgi:hypothetical protein
VRYRIHRRQKIEENPEPDVYFWDGEVCVTSRIISIGDPATSTLSVPNLHGVSLNQDRCSGLGFLAYTICGIFFGVFGVASYPKYPVLCFILLGSAGLILYRLLRTNWSVTLKMGGILSDEVFTSHRREWAEKFAAAVGRAMAAAQSGDGDSPMPSQAILPDPVFSRN